MELFRADLHIHSRFSRATSKTLDTRKLAAWARIKGLDVLGTSDFTHSAWREELKENLAYDERSGLYKLKDTSHLDREVPGMEGYALSGETLFMPQTEISSIYKRGGKVRKVHNLVFMPTLEAAEAFSKRLSKVGNLESDGRPILGLDSRDLLEMVLETDPLAFLVPAHIWTPWFSVFGSKSGFDSIEECFGDLSDEIFALETGLSSDPEMNWQISALDRFRLISNSDAHSAEKLGREANLFSGAPSYEGIYRALRGEALGHKFLGTMEFFPEEGKYHLDGHRKCGVVMVPREALSRDCLCPVCGKPLTLGVLHRVTELADRDTPQQPPNQPGYVSLIPLPEIISEIVGTGPNTKKVREFYNRCITHFGTEMTILQDAPPDELKRVSPLLAEAVDRMRRGEVFREPGFDGQYGVVKVFTPKERREFKQGKLLTGIDLKTKKASTCPEAETQDETTVKVRKKSAKPESVLDEEARQEAECPPVLNASQQRAIDSGPAPTLVIAGPGTGKTHTLIQRVAALVDKGENPRHVLSVTFTRRAAQELGERLMEHFGENASLPRADTLHALALEVWTNAFNDAPVLLSEDGGYRLFVEANSDESKQELRAAWKRISLNRERMQDIGDDYELYHGYVKLKESWDLVDFTDLLEFWLEQIQADIYSCPYTQILVDEVQDLSALQLSVVKALLPKGGEGFFAIGDPNQSIYSFRGAKPDVIGDLKEQWSDLNVMALEENYRSAQPVLDLAAGLFREETSEEARALTQLQAKLDIPGEVRLFQAPTDMSEASWIGDRVRWLIGGTSHSLADQEGDSATDPAHLHAALSPGDIAVLVRFKGLIPTIKKTLERLGLPCSAPEKEAFWLEPRVAGILSAAGRFLGMAENPNAEQFTCPDSVVAKGPLSIAAYFQEMPPFDRLFWEGRDFRQMLKAYDEAGNWATLVNWVNLQSEMDLAGKRSEKIRIMSLHAAKGLEFRAVFLPALEEGVLPFAGPGFLSGKANEDIPDKDEEKRLLYVGITRAKEALYLSHASKRMLFGHEMRLNPSHFLQQLPLDLVQRTSLKAKTKRKEKQLSLLG